MALITKGCCFANSDYCFVKPKRWWVIKDWVEAREANRRIRSELVIVLNKLIDNATITINNNGRI